jgi:cell division transport system ATP-binding protein
MELAVNFENVGIRYGKGKEILHNISFSLERGSFTFISGRSGAGKTTLLRLLHLAQRPTYGSIHILGHHINSLAREDLPAIRRRIGVMFQDFRLLDHLTATENVALPLRIAGASESQILSHVRELLDWVGLQEQKDEYPDVLSGGQKQRIALARAIITRPPLLLADEPTGNVDEENALKVMYLLQELNKLGTTVVVASHREELMSERNFEHFEIVGGNVITVRRNLETA